MVHAIPDLPCHLVEWYRPELNAESVGDMITRLNAAIAEMIGQAIPVQLLVTLAVPADEVLYGVFAACSPDVVVDVCERAGVPPHRLSADVGARIEAPS